MLESTLKRDIPSKLNSFNKLTKERMPYYFAAWDDKDDTTVLCYWFWNKTKTSKNKKRVFISEVEALLKYMLSAEKITRNDYKRYCPRTNSDGTCGFAVIIRILEYLQVIKIIYAKYQVKNVDIIQKFLA